MPTRIIVFLQSKNLPFLPTCFPHCTGPFISRTPRMHSPTYLTYLCCRCDSQLWPMRSQTGVVRGNARVGVPVGVSSNTLKSSDGSSRCYPLVRGAAGKAICVGPCTKGSPELPAPVAPALAFLASLLVALLQHCQDSFPGFVFHHLEPQGAVLPALFSNFVADSLCRLSRR